MNGAGRSIRGIAGEPVRPKGRGRKAQTATASLFVSSPTPEQKREKELTGAGRQAGSEGGPSLRVRRPPWLIHVCGPLAFKPRARQLSR